MIVNACYSCKFLHAYKYSRNVIRICCNKNVKVMLIICENLLECVEVKVSHKILTSTINKERKLESIKNKLKYKAIKIFTFWCFRINSILFFSVLF